MLLTSFQSPQKYMPIVSLQSCFSSRAMNLPFDEKMQPFELLNLGDRITLIVLSVRL